MQEYSISKLGHKYPLDEITQMERDYLSELSRMTKIGANSKCADCGANYPNWASCNLGLTVDMLCYVF